MPSDSVRKWRFARRGWVAVACLFLLSGSSVGSRMYAAAQDLDGKIKSVLGELNAESDPERRAQHALSLADNAFAEAREAYQKGQIKAGDASLDEMIKVLNVCVTSLDAGHKARHYKQAELRVATLIRRLKSLIEDLSVNDRGWAEYTARQLDDIHDKLLSGVMKK